MQKSFQGKGPGTTSENLSKPGPVGVAQAEVNEVQLMNLPEKSMYDENVNVLKCSRRHLSSPSTHYRYILWVVPNYCMPQC